MPDPAEENLDKDNRNSQETSGADATVFRDETVMRGDLSVSASLTGSSWRSGDFTGATGGEAETPKVLKQRFVLEERIGTGGMGSVFRSKDLRKVEARDSQPFIAVKVLNNDFRNHPEAFIALEREASKSQGLRHKNIVSIFDFDKDGDVPFITMELLEGSELADLLKSYPNGLPEDLAWTVIQGMVEGLSHAHDEGVVHADFKPGNVFVTNRQTKILDFGIARAMRLNSGGEDTDFDPSRLAALTPAYASREMLNGDNPEPRDDLFSLGVVIYMVLTGHHPYGRTPANEAAKEGLKPERIKQLSRRRWRILERCLQFNRQNRPANAHEVLEGLFGKTSWQIWSLVATGVLVTVSVLAMLHDSADIQEVKLEVRQETLVDAQLARIAGLLRDPQFDPAWERLLFSEVQTLRTFSPDPKILSAVNNRIEEAYAGRIRNIETLEGAFAQLAASSKFGATAQAREVLHERVLVTMHDLSNQPVDDAWLALAEQMLAYAQAHFPRSTALAAARVELVAHLNLEVPRLISAGEVDLAQNAWAAFEEQVFEEEAWLDTDTAMQGAVDKAQAAEAAAVAQVRFAELEEEMAELLDVSCLRLDVGLLKNRMDVIRAAHPQHHATLLNRTGEAVGRCVTRLSAVDPDRAATLNNEARRQFGALAQLAATNVDPCAPHYLVGNGGASGRGSFCVDRLSEFDQGPKLVVVPGTDAFAKFAVSRTEVSWREFNAFCEATGQCAPGGDERMPVTGVSVELVEEYATWLSELAGFTYRLPTAEEWIYVARGTDDPNRNCRIELGGVSRGDGPLAAASGAANPFGLVNVLGNVQEMVRNGESYDALGGAYSDPLEQCSVDSRREVRLAGDRRTGFRLVREVS